MGIASNGQTGGAAAGLELVVAVAENDVIGRGNQLPWHLPADLRHFKSLTLGKPVLMGRKTYESIGKALPGRTNIVLSRAADFSPGDCVVVNTLEEARIAAGGERALMVIGGAEIYRQCLPLARPHPSHLDTCTGSKTATRCSRAGGARSGTSRRASVTRRMTRTRMPTASSRSSEWKPRIN